MKERMKKIIHIMGAAATLSLLLAMPVYAEGNQETQAEVKQEAEQATKEVVDQESPASPSILEVDAWIGKAAASVTTCANIRSEATIESERLAVLPRAGIADVVESGEEWTKIQSGDITGYIRNDLLVFDEAAKNLYEETYGITGTVTASNLKVREDASMEAEQIDSYAEGAKVNLVGSEGEWYTVAESDENQAYLHADYITVDEPEHKAMTEDEYYQAQIQQEAEEAQKQVEQESEEASASSAYASEGELSILAAIIECEAGGESYEGMVAVGAVVMNRMNSGQFPNSISEVVYQSGQFSPVASGGLSNVLSRGARSDCYAAASDALNGSNPVGDCLYFNSGSGQGIQIGNQHFY